MEYSSFRIGFGKIFGFRSDQIQIDALNEIDQHTIRGILRTSDQFRGLSDENQSSLFASIATTNWPKADSLLKAQVGQQAADEMRQGSSKNFVVRKLDPKDKYKR